MRKLLILPLAALAFVAMSFQAEHHPISNNDAEVAVPGKEYVYIKLDNQCSREVKYNYKYSGGGTSGSISKNYKKQLTISVGSKLYIDGEFFMEIEKSHDKQTFVVCK